MSVPVRLLLACLIAASAGCSSRQPAAALREVSVPDLSRMDPAVQAQLRQRDMALRTALARAGATDAERADAFGRLGMLLHAAEYYDSAEPAYLNARMLAPREPRWPYYLAHLYKSLGDTEAAKAAFARVLELRPDDVATLIWLGRLYLDAGEVAKAEPLFARARDAAPRTVAALVGLGQAALARRDFARAAAVLEEALAADPAAASVHSPLAAAYRGAGDPGRAETHLKQWRNVEVLVPDPLRLELDLALDSGLAFELRGVRALAARDFTAAADFFRRGASMTPASDGLGRSLRHKLGTALYMSGDTAGAVAQFEEVIRFAPGNGLDETAARAHYSLGVLAASGGHAARAIAHLEAAVAYSPNYVEARQALGDAYRRNRRDAEALPHYAALLSIDPQAAEARFGYAIALVRLGRDRAAREWLEQAVVRHPGRPEFRHALARVLAAARTVAVRDGARALALVDDLMRGPKTVDLGETAAMALAENGRFAEAAAVQRQVIKAAADAGIAIDRPRMIATLRLYESGRPSRVPWSDDDPIHAPGPRLAD